MTGFAINLDLSLYFDDLRKCASVFVDLGKCKDVGDVEKHIKSVFKLEENICLTNSTDFLIPRCEDIQILKFQQHETLKVQKCDFFDYQIHRYKRNNAACEQTALNLIHSERTIDLSCRPRQRFKLSNKNQCSNTNAHLLLTPLQESITKLSQPSTPSTSGEGISQTLVKDRQKSKKKKHHILNESGNISDSGNGHDILDMSFKKPKNKNYENCFTINETLQLADKPSSKIFLEERKCVAVDEEGSGRDYHKKVKKRKCNSQNDDVDIESSCWTSWSPDNNSFSKSNTKGHKKHKSKKCSTEESEMVTDLSMDASNFYGEELDSIHSSANFEEKTIKRKHKKDKKHSEMKEPHEVFQDKGDSSNYNQSNHYFHSSVLYLTESDCTKINYNDNDAPNIKKRKNKLKLRENNIEDSYIDLNDSINQFQEEKQNHMHESIGSANERKEKTCTNENREVHLKVFEPVTKKYLKQIDRYLFKMSPNGSQHSLSVNENSTLETIEEISPGNTNGLEGNNIKEFCNDQVQELKPCSELLETKVRRKRVRKHNKKKKRENVQYLSAVGPMLNRLCTQRQLPVTPSEAAKHVYFNDDDFKEETKIPPTPNRSYKEDEGRPETKDHGSQVTTFMETPEEHVLSVKGPGDARERNISENTKTPEKSSPKPETWKNRLLKLASCSSSKPVIFRRFAPSLPVNQQSQTPTELSCHEHSPTVSSAENDRHSLVTNVCNAVSERQDCNKAAETTVNCNGEENSAKKKFTSNSESSTLDGKKDMPDATNTLESNADKIILTNYPIIDKVVDGDLILFKVSRMDENNPVLSKTILGLVKATANFPEKISLQIIEGCEECTKLKSESGEQSTEGFMLELRWVDILEPRLFYP